MRSLIVTKLHKKPNAHSILSRRTSGSPVRQTSRIVWPWRQIMNHTHFSTSPVKTSQHLIHSPYRSLQTTQNMSTVPTSTARLPHGRRSPLEQQTVLCASQHSEGHSPRQRRRNSSVAQRNLVFSSLKRGLLRISGRDSQKLLQGLMTQDIIPLGQGIAKEISAKQNIRLLQKDTVLRNHQIHKMFQSKLLYTSFLNSQGRVLWDCFVWRNDPHVELPEGADRQFLLDVEPDKTEEIMGHLKKFKLRSKVTFEDISQDWQVSVLFPQDQHSTNLSGTQTLTPQQDEKLPLYVEDIHAGLTNLTSDPAAHPLFSEMEQDPRSPLLGVRFLSQVKKGSRCDLGQELGKIFKSVDGAKEFTVAEDEDAYYRFNLCLGAPQGSKALIAGSSLPLESNLHLLNAISFDKGCYTGQELTARTYHTGVTRKAVFPIEFSSQVSAEAFHKSDDTSEGGQTHGEIFFETPQGRSKKPVGKIVSILPPSHGAGLMRLENLGRFFDQEESTRLIVSDATGVSHQLRVLKPFFVNEFNREK